MNNNKIDIVEHDTQKNFAWPIIILFSHNKKIDSMLDNKINILSNNEVIKIAHGLIVHENCIILKLIAIKTATELHLIKWLQHDS